MNADMAAARVRACDARRGADVMMSPTRRSLNVSAPLRSLPSSLVNPLLSLRSSSRLRLT